MDPQHSKDTPYHPLGEAALTMKATKAAAGLEAKLSTAGGYHRACLQMSNTSRSAHQF